MQKLKRCMSVSAACCAGAFTFSVPTEVGFGVEADPNPPRLMGAPFAADLHASHCYAILPCGQVESSFRLVSCHVSQSSKSSHCQTEEDDQSV